MKISLGINWAKSQEVFGAAQFAPYADRPSTEYSEQNMTINATDEIAKYFQDMTDMTFF